MIDELKPYPEYKDSGLPWLGMVPAHWDIRRLRSSVTDCVTGLWGTEPDGENDIICVRVADFDRTNHTVSLRNPTIRGIPSTARTRRLLANGDLLLEKSGGGDLQPVGAVVLYNHDDLAVCSNFVAKMPLPKGYNGQFVNYLHSVLYSIRLNVRSIKQTTGIQNLDSKAYLAELVAFPPVDEQAAIVRFLDHANGKIERAMRAKKKLIALLNEQKQAIIHRAVTRGLDPNVKLKPSGIPWLGDVLEHWKTLQVRRVISFLTSGSRSWAKYYSDDGFIFLQSGNLGRSMSLNLAFVQHVRPPGGAEGERTRVRIDDVLVCVTGALTGNVAIVESELHAPAFVNQHVALVRPNPHRIAPRFLAYALHSEVGRKQFKTQEYGGTKQGLGLGDVKSVFIPVPSLEEQHTICAALDREIASSAEGINRTEREIALLSEYRTTLTADVVTGKLDVREAVAHLPAETETPLAVDDLPDDIEDEPAMR